jgi:hypothetical protein
LPIINSVDAINIKNSSTMCVRIIIIIGANFVERTFWANYYLRYANFHEIFFLSYNSLALLFSLQDEEPVFKLVYLVV